LLGGVGLSQKVTLPAGGVVWILGLGWLLTWRARNSITLLITILLGLSLGGWRGSVYVSQLSDYKALYYQPVTIKVRAGEDGVYNQTKQMAFDASDIRLGGQRLKGRISLSGFGANAIFAGDRIEAAGKLYPAHGSYQGRMSFAKLTVLGHHPTIINEIKRKFVAGTETALPEPLAPFAIGLLVGQRANLPDAVKQDLLKVGLTHIIAVSGANLTIILRASQRLLSKRSKRLSTFLTLGLMAVFLALSGAGASIVRAAIVSTLSIAAAYYGRRFKPLNLIFLAAVITAWANPSYIWGDVSWYLSFLAFFGVMILAPQFQARWSGRWHRSVVAAVALESICAEIMTLPFVLHVFGQMSRVGLIANVLVVIFIPLAMLLSAIAGLAGMLIGNVAGWLAWPAVIILNYVLDVAHLLAGRPHVFVQGIGLSLQQMSLLYGCLGLIITALWQQNRRKNVIITDRNVRAQQMVND
jgi:ComEC/Rec2-related protein